MVVRGVGVGDGGHQTVGQVVGGVVQDVVVRTVHGRDVLPGGGGVGARHAGDFLAHGVRVGRRDAEVLHRLRVQGDGGDGAPALVRIGQDVGVLAGVPVVGRIDVPFVGAVEGHPAGVVLRDVVVGEHHAVDGLVEDVLGADGQREGEREGVVDGEGALPHLRHLEVVVHAGDFARGGGRLRGDAGRILVRVDAVQDVEDRPAVGHEVAAGHHPAQDLGILHAGHTALDDTGVGRHVGEEHQRDTAGEEAGAAADLQALVPEDVPGEAQTGAHLDAGLGPFAGVHVLAAEVELVGRVVGHDVLVVEGQVVQTQAGGELDAVVHGPFILDIGADLGETHFRGRIFVPVEAPVEGHLDRGVARHEVAHAGEPEHAGTVAHVGVQGHLGLHAGAGGHLVGAQVQGDVVLDVQHRVLDLVPVGEQLGTEVHVRLVGVVGTEVAGEDFHEREETAVIAADVLDVGVRDQELVGNLVREAGVQVRGDRPEVVHLVVQRVGEHEAVLGDHAEAHVGHVAGGGRSRPLVVVRVVVPEGQVVLLADVPVDAGEELQVALVLVVVVVGTRIVVVVLDEEVPHLLGLGDLDTGDHAGLVLDAVLGRTPLDDLGRARGALGVDEEEQLVLDDRAAQGEAVRGLAFRGTLEVHAVDAVAVHVLVLVIGISRPLERVRTGLRDGVDTAADEVRLTDVVRGHDHLHFLDGVDGNRVAAARQGRRQAEVVVHVRAVHGEVGGTAGAAGEVHPVTAVRRELGHVGEAPADGRHLDHLAGGDVRGRAGFLHGRELGGRGRDDDGLREELGGLRKLGVQVERFGQGKGDVRVVHLLVAQAGDLDPVRAATSTR